LPAALKAAARNSVIPVELHGGAIGRYPEDVEVAVYFCCLEALQNVAKHGGADATAIVALHEDERRLQFEVRDDGAGFDPAKAETGSGLLNMSDRIEAVGGTVHVTSRSGRGTCVRGGIPVS
jgi:signal transduction histidine kinase